MKFNLVSIFPELINDYIKYGLLSKALEKRVLEVRLGIQEISVMMLMEGLMISLLEVELECSSKQNQLSIP